MLNQKIDTQDTNAFLYITDFYYLAKKGSGIYPIDYYIHIRKGHDEPYSVLEFNRILHSKELLLDNTDWTVIDMALVEPCSEETYLKAVAEIDAQKEQKNTGTVGFLKNNPKKNKKFYNYLCDGLFLVILLIEIYIVRIFESGYNHGLWLILFRDYGLSIVLTYLLLLLHFIIWIAFFRKSKA